MFAQKIKKQIIALFDNAVQSLYDMADAAFAPKVEYIPVPVRVDHRR